MKKMIQTSKRMAALLCLVLCLAGMAMAQEGGDNAPLTVVFNNLTYNAGSGKVTTGKVLGAIADALVGQTTQEHENYLEAVRAALVKGMAQSRRVSMADGGTAVAAQWYVDGTVSNISSTTKVEERKDAKGKTYKQTYYKGLVGVALQVKDAQSGQILLSPTFNVYAEDLSWIETREGAMNSALARLSAKVTKYFNTQLPLTAHIIEGARDKNDKQKEVYIDLGTATKGVGKGIHFGVYTQYVVAGKTARKLVGKLKLQETMGDDVSLCKVQSGGKEIKAAIDAGQAIAVLSVD